MVYLMGSMNKAKVYQYTAVFEEAPEGGYSVTIPSLPGCISEGDTFEEAFHNIHEAASLYLEIMKRRRKSILSEERIIVAPVKVKA